LRYRRAEIRDEFDAQATSLTGERLPPSIIRWRAASVLRTPMADLRAATDLDARIATIDHPRESP
jgi:hypothetical protein